MTSAEEGGRWQTVMRCGWLVCIVLYFVRHAMMAYLDVFLSSFPFLFLFLGRMRLIISNSPCLLSVLVWRLVSVIGATEM